MFRASLCFYHRDDHYRIMHAVGLLLFLWSQFVHVNGLCAVVQAHAFGGGHKSISSGGWPAYAGQSGFLAHTCALDRSRNPFCSVPCAIPAQTRPEMKLQNVEQCDRVTPFRLRSQHIVMSVDGTRCYTTREDMVLTIPFPVYSLLQFQPIVCLAFNCPAPCNARSDGKREIEVCDVA
jgi:hypothetical protein